MRIVLKTRVKGHYLKVIERFDRDLFEALKPKGAKMEIVEFTGSKKGDRVHVRFVSPFKADWISDITEDGHAEDKAWFVDEGVKMPFGLTLWKHRHLVVADGSENAVVVDDIHYKGVNGVWSCLMYLPLLLGFYPRKRIYQEYFGRATS